MFSKGAAGNAAPKAKAKPKPAPGSPIDRRNSIMVASDIDRLLKVRGVPMHGPTVAPWNHSPKGPPKEFLKHVGKMPQSKSQFFGRFKGQGTWEYAGTIGNVYSFAHKKQMVQIRKKNTYFVTNLLLQNV